MESSETKPKQLNLGRSPLRILLHLAGYHTIFGEHVKIADLPEQLGKSLESITQALSVLYDKGFLLGTPKHFRINYVKISALKASETALNASQSRPKEAPALLTLLKHFNAEHSRIRKEKPRTNNLGLVHFRNLCRKYDAHLVMAAIGSFFASESIRQIKKPLSTQDFHDWTDKQLRSRLRKERK